MKTGQKNIKSLVLLLLILIGINLLAAGFYKRIDLTKDKRYTLSQPAKEVIDHIEQPIFVSVYLKGDFPSNFKRLENETRYLLEEFANHNRLVKFEFIDPIKGNEANPEAVGNDFFEAGMPPRRLNVRKSGQNTQTLIFPWAVATYGEQSTRIPLLRMNPEDTEDELVTHSVQGLEYAFANAFKQLTTEKTKKIAVMRGNGELHDMYLADFLQSAGVYYRLAPFTLDSVTVNPQRTLEQLTEYDMIIEAKPTKAFTEKEKFVLDQYLMQGGKALWLVDAVVADKDSLFTHEDNRMLAYPHDLNLTEFFFQYGVRINPSLINDLHADNIILATGQGKQTQFEHYPFFYSPLVIPESGNPIAHSIDPIRFDFASPMDTLKNNIRKTVLLKSSVATKVEGTPMEIDLNILLNDQPDFSTYQHGPQNLAVLLEGEFTSVYKSRIKPFDLKNPLENGVKTSMLVVSDGDIIKNEIVNGQPESLEYDPRTGKTYGNKEFLLNALHYMLDDTGLLNIRTKTVNIGFLSPEKIEQKKLFWQGVNLVLPLIILVVFGLGYKMYRKKKYS